MKIQDISGFPDNIKREFGTTNFKCPYHNGKIIVSNYKKYSIETITRLISGLKSMVSNTMIYKEVKEQFNIEKEIEYNLTHYTIKERMPIAYKYYEENLTKSTISIKDLKYLSLQPYSLLRDKVEKRFKDINKYIKNNYSGEYRKGEEYSKLKDSLVEKGLRKANQSDKNGFERIEDISIVNQLTANTRSYIQYLYQTNKNNDNYIYDIKNSKAPKFWFFSSQFGGQVIRDAVTDSIREYIENDKLVDFYDDSNKFGLSQDALSTIENKIKSIQSLTPNFAKSVEKKGFTRDFFLPDENIYGCPVQDSFTKFYHITLNALIED